MFRTGANGLNQNKLIFLAAACLFTYVQGSFVLRFATEPSDASVPGGGALWLHCASTAGAPGARTSWRWAPALPLEEAPLLDTTGDPYRKILDNGTLELTELGTGAQAGDYQCLISAEGVGTIVSRVATVTLPSLPTFDAEPQDLTVYPGESAFFACSVRGRIPSYTKPSALGRQHHVQPPGPLDIKIQWLKNEAPIRLDETRMTVLPTGALEIDPVGAQDRGAYRCNVSRLATPGYRLSNKAQLTINTDMTLAETVTAPKFIAEPRSLTVTEGSPVTMDCAASGNPRPDITWLNNGVAIDLNHLDSRFTLLGSGVLYISSVKESDAGTYQCRADNREDSLDATAMLDVQVPPRFMKRPLDVTATERQDLELECQVYGRPEPTVRWLKNGEVITPNNHDMALVGGYNLRIQGLMPVDVGIFQCVASNPAGNIQASAQLTVLSAGASADNDEDAATSVAGRKIPSEPLEFTAPIVKARFVALSWSEPMTTNGDILAYSVIYKVKGSVRERITNTTRGDVYKMSIPSLQPNTAYHFRALAYNRNGAGVSTQVLEISTQSEELSLGAPRDVRVTLVGPTALQVSWVAPQPVPGAKVTLDKYELLWAESDSPEERSIITSELTHRLVDLHPFTEYAVRVVAHSAGSGPLPGGGAGSPGGSGSPSEQVVTRTPGDAPNSAPLNLTLQPQTSSTVLVIWEAPPPESRNGDITGYKVRYRPHAGRSKTQLLTTPADIRSVILNNLDRMATYQVRVCAFNVNGTGPFTEWKSVDTLQNDLDESQVPAEPSPLKTQAGSDSIYVSWAPPLRNQNTRVRGYILTWGKGVPDMFFHSVGELIRHHTITDLEPNSEYVITLRASNNVGEGPPVYATVRTRDPGDADGDLDPGEEEGDEEEGAEGVGARAQGPQLIPPVGVKADVLSGNTAVVYWTDTTLTKSQVTDQRFYVVRYSSIGAQRHKYFNTTHLNCMIDDLKPFTQYEFTVKMVKGNRESPWSMVVVNSTLEAAPGSGPREVRVAPGTSPFSIMLHWLPPNKANGAITGYVILYTTDRTKRDRDWVVQAVVGGGTSAAVRPLQPNTAYHFKVQARNAQGYGPFSHDVTFTTIPGIGFEEADSISSGKEARHGYSMMVYIGAGVVVVLLLVTGVVATVICCRKGSAEPAPSPDSRAKTTYQKSSASNIKPPDLWIHHDQMELKQMDKSHHSTSGSGDGVSGVSSMTLPRPSRDSCEYDTALPAGHSNPPCSSLDKRHYVPTYVGSSSPVCGELSLGGNSSMGGASSRNSAFLSTGGQSGSSRTMIIAKPKPMLNVEHYSRDPSMSSINTCTISSSNPDAIPPGMRPMYPRTQYPVPSQPSRHHLNIDQNTPLLSAAGSSISGTLPSQSSISSLGQVSALHHHHPAMGISPMSCSQMSCVAGAPPCPSPSPASEGFPDSAREREQGHYVAYEALHPPRDSLEAAGASGSLTRRGAPVHPLRSFSVPAPPPSDAPHTPHHHVSVTIRPTNTSPYKKPLVPAVPVNQSPSSHLGQGSLGLNRLQQGMLVPHSNDELEPLAPSCSTERLHQEMANLEGLMKDLNAITANQFEC